MLDCCQADHETHLRGLGMRLAIVVRYTKIHNYTWQSMLDERLLRGSL